MSEITEKDIKEIRDEVCRMKSDLEKRVKAEVAYLRRSLQSSIEWRSRAAQRSLIDLEARISNLEDGPVLGLEDELVV